MAFKQYRILFKLVNPSIMDSEGVKMLKSIDMVFELLPISMNKVVFVKETIKKSDLMAEIKINKKCPVVQTIDLSARNWTALEESLHVMVATGVYEKPDFIQCKNSYRHNKGKFILVHIFWSFIIQFFHQSLHV